MSTLISSTSNKASPFVQVSSSGETQSFQDSVVNLPMEASRCKITASFLLQQLQSNSSANVLIVSEQSYSLRHVIFEAEKLDPSFKGSVLKALGSDTSRKNRTVFATTERIGTMRRCQSNQFDLIICIDITTQPALQAIEAFLEKHPHNKTAWVTEPSKQSKMLAHSSYLNKSLREKKLSYVEFDFTHGLIHSPQKLYLKGAAPSIEAYERAFEDSGWEQ